MNILGDYHTHTIYSSGKHNSRHATGTIFENAKIAKEKGLKEIGITEHGFGHKLFGVKRENISKMREEIKEAEEKLRIKILLGVEANIISSDGDIDLTKEEIGLFDYIAVGFHSCAKAKNAKEFFKFFLPNILGFKGKKEIERNTKALVMAMENNPISFITHPGVNFALDLGKICDTANKTKTKLEINGKRIAYTENDVEILKLKKPVLIINSDAHTPERVGEVNFPTNFAFKNNIENMVQNFDNEPEMIK